MRINPYTLNKDLQKQFFEGRCRHRHTYSEHPGCFQTEILKKGEVMEGYLDIETTGFEANYQHMLTYVIKQQEKKKYFEGVINKDDILNYKFDNRICKALVTDLNRFDVIYTYYGARFDVPFMRSRCIKQNIRFPEFGHLQHKDVYYMVKNKLKMHRASLEAATRFFGINDKNHVEPDIWMRARVGDPKALKYVLDHNRRDCDILEKLHKKLSNYAMRTTRSL